MCDKCWIEVTESDLKEHGNQLSWIYSFFMAVCSCFPPILVDSQRTGFPGKIFHTLFIECYGVKEKEDMKFHGGNCLAFETFKFVKIY